MAGLHSGKRCGCRGDDGRPLGNACPRLRRAGGSWNPAHGTWYGRAALPPAAGRRQELRAGGWARETDLTDWFTAALQLMAVPDRGPGGDADRLQIAALIRETRRRGQPLPDYDDVRRRHQHGVAFATGTTGDYLTGWLEGHRRSGDIRASTLRGYELHVRLYFLPVFGGVPLDRLRVSHVARAFEVIDERNAALAAALAAGDPAARGKRVTGPVTKQRIRATLRAALADAASADTGLLAVNVAKLLRLPPGKRARARPWTRGRVAEWEARYQAAAGGVTGERARFAVWQLASMRPSPVMVWTPAQIGAFLDFIADDRLYALYHLIAFRGLRRGEACGLRWADVDLDNGRLDVVTQIVQLGWATAESAPKTEASDSSVTLDKATVRALRAWRKIQAADRMRLGTTEPETGRVFTLQSGQMFHPDRLTDIFEWAAFRAGLPPIRLHDLRHGAASLAHAAGADMKSVSALLRHSSIAITADTYTSVFAEADAELAEDMARQVPRLRAVSGEADAPTMRPRRPRKPPARPHPRSRGGG